ncbi:MAG: T9SS type A sorting domain-containing protein [Bacteroidota bacterium]
MSKQVSYIATRIILSLLISFGGLLSFQGLQGQSFGLSRLDLKGASLTHPTSLDFGPDGKLYVAVENGQIFAIEVERTAANDYAIKNIDNIHLVQEIPNHHEDGNPAPEINNRKVNGLILAGTPEKPVIYVSSYDPRDGVSGNGDMNLDTNSGIISKLNWTGEKWEIIHLVRGLPRGKEKHGSNGLALSLDGKTLFVAQAGHTNAGAPSQAFALSSEYALSAGILSLDLKMIESLPTKRDEEGQRFKYDLPTVKHTDLMGGGDISSSKAPWGGLDGLNQSRLVLGGPVQVYAPGFRDPYDILISSKGFMYSTDNGAKLNQGGYPQGAGKPNFDGHRLSSNISNELAPQSLADNAASSTARVASDNDILDTENSLHLVSPGYFAGHPNPIRANPSGAGLYLEGSFRRMAEESKPKGWPPVDLSLANPSEANYRRAESKESGVLFQMPVELKGITEYTASNFQKALQGDILVSTFDQAGKIQKISPSPNDGKGYPGTTLISGLGNGAIDLVALGDEEVFPGTIWALIYHENKITILEPADYKKVGTSTSGCTGKNTFDLDDDGDGYSNGDEMDPRNATDPCSAESMPLDSDGTLINGFKVSDWNDPDDDDDGIPDTQDAFAWDPTNGQANKNFPVHLSFKEGNRAKDPFKAGLTGIMSNGKLDYQIIKAEAQLLDGNGRNHAFIIESNQGSALGNKNTDQNSYQTGLNLCGANDIVWVRSRIQGPFFNGGSAKEYLQGVYLGTGDQDNFLFLGLSGDGQGGGGFSILEEAEGEGVATFYPVDLILAETQIDLYWEIDPFENTVQAYFSAGASTDIFPIGPSIRVSGKLLSAMNCSYQIDGVSSSLAVGLMTESGSAPAFSAQYDFLEMYGDRQSCALSIRETEIDFQAISENTNKSYNLNLQNPLMFDMDVSHVQITGKDAAAFSIDQRSFADLNTQKEANLQVNFQPASSGAKEAVLQIFTTCSSKAIEIPLKGIGATFSEVLYRVNVGGMEIPATDGALDWMADEGQTAMPYLKRGGETITGGSAVANLSYDASVPGLTPPELFERGRKSIAKEMKWSFPLNQRGNGLYQLCLYLLNPTEEDAFEIWVEGEKVKTSFSQLEKDAAQKAITLCFPVQLNGDGKLDIVFYDGTESPKLNALEIRATEEKTRGLNLPVNDFRAEVQNKDVNLTWKSSFSEESQGFVIQMMQARDGSAALFQDIAFIAESGIAGHEQAYVYQVEALVPDNYVFRIKKLDKSGNYTYGPRINTSIISDGMGLYTYPNPSKGMLNIVLTTNQEQNVSIKLLDVNGKLVKALHTGSMHAGSHKMGFNIGGLPNGIYMLEAQGANKRELSKVILSK